MQSSPLTAAAQEPVGALRAAIDGAREYFRHHGIWSPGVRTFRRLSFLGKAALVCVFFTLVVVQLGYLFLQGSLRSTAQSDRAARGLTLVGALLPVYASAQDLRTELLASGGKGSAPSRAALEQVGNALGQFAQDVADTAYAEPTRFALQALEPLKAAAEDGEDGFRKADEFSQQLQRLMVAVADLSGLSMDPEQASYHLMLASTQETFAAVGMLRRVRDLGAHAMARNELSSAAHRTIVGDTYILYRQLELLFARYERVVKARPELEGALDYQKAFDPVNAFVRGWRRGVLAPSGPAGDAAAFAQAGGAASAALLELTRRSHAALAGLIAERRQAALSERLVQLAFVAAGLLFMAYLFYCFFLVTRGGMLEVTRHIRAMADGDLTTTPRPWGRDEAAEVMRAVHDMQVSLRQVIGQVRESAIEIAASSVQVSSGAEDLSLRTEHTAARLQQAAATMEGVSASVKDTSLRVDESATRGTQAAKDAQHSQAAIGSVVAQMQRIEASARRVGEILGVIDSIAFQTNILALNAAVEAARAGEHGRGFAVVAGEVRQLAHRSAQAAKDINGLLASSVEATDQGAQSVREASAKMDALAGTVGNISEMLQVVRQATGQQTADLANVTQSVTQVDDDTQRNAALVEQTTATSMSLRTKAAGLTELASRFRLPAATATPAAQAGTGRS